MYPQQAMAHRGDKRTEKLNPDEKARIHVNTERVAADRRLYGQLAAAGMTDAGIDLKGIRLGTFQRIKGVEDGERAEFYLENAWNAMKYLLENYPEVFVGMGIPYNKALLYRGKNSWRSAKKYQASIKYDFLI